MALIDITPDFLNKTRQHTLVAHLGIVFTEVGENYICAKMPVDQRTHQPMGILHGGASVALAETLGSIGGYYSLDTQKQYCVGLEINANHLRSVREGWVYGRAEAVHLGRTTQLWDIRITDEGGKLVCISRLTLAVIYKK
jgi:1,4-dihydroxy-2-naphthoyl-CoA hydrolase